MSSVGSVSLVNPDNIRFQINQVLQGKKTFIIHLFKIFLKQSTHLQASFQVVRK